MSSGPRWAKTSIFSIFRKVFKNEENHHILTSGQLKYKNSLIWMKNVQKCELSKKCPQFCTLVSLESVSLPAKL